MRYLVKTKRNKKAVAHFWNGSDTLCKHWGSGGIRSKHLYKQLDTTLGLPMCKICIHKQQKLDDQRSKFNKQFDSHKSMTRENRLIPFGKYKGRDFKDILSGDPQYIGWALSRSIQFFAKKLTFDEQMIAVNAFNADNRNGQKLSRTKAGNYIVSRIAKQKRKRSVTEELDLKAIKDCPF